MFQGGSELLKLKSAWD